MRAKFSALFLCGLLVVACATDGQKQPIVHPKARKADPTSVSANRIPAVVAAPAPASVLASVPMPVPVEPPRLPTPPRVVTSIAPPSPPIVAPVPTILPSEIPTRAPRRVTPDWVRPSQKAPTVPTTQTPAPSVTPPPLPVPTPVAMMTPRPRPVLSPVPSPRPSSVPSSGQTPAPLSAQRSELVAEAAPRPSSNSSFGPLIINRATGTKDVRLPCNRAGSPFCDLRIYQINVGTFVDGSPDHNPIGGYGPGPHTGDIEGVVGALDYIKALGFNTIWLTPIFDTKAGQPQARPTGRPQVNERLDGTGYFPRDYFRIDPQFGTLEQTQYLVDQAHALGIKIIFDGVFGHHKGDVVPSPTGALPVDATASGAYGGNPQTYPGRIVDYNNVASTAFYKEVARYWIDTLGIDGWRLDQVYQVPSGPLREITAEINKASNAQLLSGYVVGEMWGTAAQIRDVLGPSNNPALASAFDFPTRYALTQTLASDENGGTGKPASTINEAWALGAHASYPDHAIMNLMLGNHDLVRFGDLIQRAGKGGPSDTEYWAIHKQAFTFMAAWSGPITFYYGEELGAEVPDFAAKVTGNCAALNQCDDHVARQMVAIPGVNTRAETATSQASNLRAYLTSLLALRASAPALSSGSRTHIFSDKDLYIDLKSDGTENYLVVMNVGASARQVTITGSALGITSLTAATVAAGSLTSNVFASTLRLTIPANGAAIVKVEGR